MKKKGFTLIELLAVLVILVIIMAIATPIILGIIDESRISANKSTVEGIVDAAELLYATSVTNDTLTSSFNGKINLSDEIKISERNYEELNVYIDKDGKISVYAIYDGICYSKLANSKDIVVEKEFETCTAPTITEIIKTDPNISENNNNLGTIDYRYTGSDAKNYVIFNNENWRIIGIVDNKIKIVRDEVMPASQFGSSNVWTGSNLDTYLNGDYYNNLSEESKNMIQASTYFYRKYSSTTYLNKNQLLSSKPSTTNITNLNIAVIDPIDYAFSMDESCPDGTNMTDLSVCTNSTWIALSGDTEWTFASSNVGFTTYDYTTIIRETGSIFSSNHPTGAGNYVTFYSVYRPALYLKDEVQLVGGTGEKTDPYILGM